MTGTQQRMLWIGLAVVVVVAAVFFTLSKPTEQQAAPKDNSPYVSLFAYHLTKKQQEQISTYLKEKSIEFQIDTSKGIQVHENQKENILVELAKHGIPSN